jgi:hypothetical protein
MTKRAPIPLSQLLKLKKRCRSVGMVFNINYNTGYVIKHKMIYTYDKLAPIIASWDYYYCFITKEWEPLNMQALWGKAYK